MNCETCQREITGRRRDARYCLECYNERKLNRMREWNRRHYTPAKSEPCQACQQPTGRGKRARYCEPCLREHLRQRSQAKYHAQPTNRKEQLLPCKQCKTPTVTRSNSVLCIQCKDAKKRTEAREYYYLKKHNQEARLKRALTIIKIKRG